MIELIDKKLVIDSIARIENNIVWKTREKLYSKNVIEGIDIGAINLIIVGNHILLIYDKRLVLVNSDLKVIKEVHNSVFKKFEGGVAYFSDQILCSLIHA